MINEAQCAAVDFLKAIQPKAKDNPQLTLAADRIQVGEPLTATVDNAEGKVLDLLFIDDEGLVYNVKGLASQTVSEGKMSFELPTDALQAVEGSARNDDRADQPIRARRAARQGASRAAALFLKLAHQIEDQDLDVGMDFAYFRARP